MVESVSAPDRPIDFDRLRMDYEQVHQTFRLLTDIRFRLLGLLPTVSAAVIAVLASAAVEDGTDTITKLFLGLLGFFVALGVVIYDLRNSQIYAAVIHRGKFLELLLNLPPNDQSLRVSSTTVVAGATDGRPGGIFRRRSSGSGSFFGVPIRHDWGTGLIYSAVLAAWAFVAASAVVPVWLSAVIGLAIGGASIGLLRALDRPGDFVSALGYPRDFE